MVNLLEVSIKVREGGSYDSIGYSVVLDPVNCGEEILLEIRELRAKAQELQKKIIECTEEESVGTLSAILN